MDKIYFKTGRLFLLLLLVISLEWTVSGQNIDELAWRYAIPDVVDMVSPAVVSIMVYGEETSGDAVQADTDNENLFFEDLPESSGTGFVIDEDGIILTNNHVIEDGDKINLILHDDTLVEDIEILGVDKISDIAVLKIPENKLPYYLPVVFLGDSDQLRVGEIVVALGNPFAFQLGSQLTVTSGIISTVNRTIESNKTIYQKFLQTDAPINPGNSGGPLVNLDGEVIGINTAIFRFAQGIGFAIPINTARDITEQLLEKGRVSRPWLGVQVSPVPNSIAKKNSIPANQGVYIRYIAPGSPADEVDLKKGDIILEINRIKIREVADLIEVIADLEVGEKVLLIVNRDGVPEHFTVTIEERPAGD